MSIFGIDNTFNCQGCFPRLKCCSKAEDSSEEVDEKVQVIAEQHLKPKKEGHAHSNIQVNIDIHNSE